MSLNELMIFVLNRRFSIRHLRYHEARMICLFLNVLFFHANGAGLRMGLSATERSYPNWVPWAGGACCVFGVFPAGEVFRPFGLGGVGDGCGKGDGGVVRGGVVEQGGKGCLGRGRLVAVVG